MKKISKYSGFIQTINELDTTGTYLDRSRILIRDRFAQTEYPKFRKMFGKVFADAPKTSGVDYGLKYEGDSNEFNIHDDSYHIWDVVFPKDFYKHFVPKGENVEEWRYKNKDIIDELMNDLSGIKIHTEGGLNRTHFPNGLPSSLKGLGLGYIIYEGLARYLGYASSRSDASSAAQKVWSQIANDPEFVGMIASGMILVFRKDFEHKGEVFGLALDEIGIDLSDIKDNSDVEEFLREKEVDVDEELLDIDFMEKFKESILEAKRKKEENRLSYEGDLAARRIKENLFGDSVRIFKKNFRFSEEELIAIKKRIAEIREYIKDHFIEFNYFQRKSNPSKEKLFAILKSNSIEVNEAQVASDVFIRRLERCLVDSFEVYSKSMVRKQVSETINAMKKAIVEIEWKTFEELVPHLQQVFESNKKKLESLEDDLDLKWISENSNFNHRTTTSLLIGASGGKYTFKFSVGERENYATTLIYSKSTIAPSKIPLDIIQLFKYFAIEAGLNLATDADAFFESKKVELEKMDILISKSYKWVGNAFTKLKIAQKVDNVVLKPIEHLELTKKLKSTDQAMKMKNAYKYLAKGLQIAYLEGGYAKALELYDTKIKNKIQDINIDVFDDPDYGLFKDRRPDAKYPAKEHIERRLKAYKQADDFNKARATIQAGIEKSADSAKVEINKVQAQSPKEVQAQKELVKAQAELEKKPIEKRSFIKRFMDFFK